MKENTTTVKKGRPFKFTEKETFEFRITIPKSQLEMVTAKVNELLEPFRVKN